MANGKLSDKKRLNAKERRVQAYTLRTDGKSYREIAQATGVSLKQAWEDVNTGLQELAELEQDKIKTLRQLELERLDRLHSAHWDKAKDGDIYATNAVLKISERRAKLLGLDKPAQLDINQNVTVGPSWNAQQMAILEALRIYPEARAAVAARLMQLTPIEGEVLNGDQENDFE